MCVNMCASKIEVYGTVRASPAGNPWRSHCCAAREL